MSNKELLADLEDEEEQDEACPSHALLGFKLTSLQELNYGKFGKTTAPKGRRLPTTRYRKHLEELKKRSKRMEYDFPAAASHCLAHIMLRRYRQKFFVMEKEKKAEELQKRLDEIDEENLRVERERRQKQGTCALWKAVTVVTTRRGRIRQLVWR